SNIVNPAAFAMAFTFSWQIRQLLRCASRISSDASCSVIDTPESEIMFSNIKHLKSIPPILLSLFLRDELRRRFTAEHHLIVVYPSAVNSITELKIQIVAHLQAGSIAHGNGYTSSI